MQQTGALAKTTTCRKIDRVLTKPRSGASVGYKPWYHVFRGVVRKSSSWQNKVGTSQACTAGSILVTSPRNSDATSENQGSNSKAG